MKNKKEKEKIIYNHDFLNKKIKEYIEYYDITLEDLAIRIGMTEKTFKRSLSNDRVFYVDELYKLVDILGIEHKDVQKAFFTIEKAKGGKDE